ncbi:YutD family protein [Lactiplantibacillus modestisalitolerans]|uniref:YutD family protein n=1 Tax=Lactiplantibacillus modestisalitolerans TaxID=1457219 RepID=A0ABV5WVW7_9LACO|nr:YutD family protein [Lactiplantibacillus modestisalitolerans]
MDREHIDALAEQQAERRRNLYHGFRVDRTHVEVNKHPFEIVLDYRQAFDLDKFVERFSPILNKYDYIVGDWGFEQLRLKGFFRDDMKDVQRAQTIGTVQDYLYEYCNFGCAYFILKNERVIKPKRTNHHREERRGKRNRNNQSRSRSNRTSSKNKQRRKQHSFTTKKKPAPFTEKAKPATKPSRKARTTKQSNGKRHFTIRQK